MPENQAEVKTLSGVVLNVEDRKGYEGRKGYRALMQVDRGGQKSTLPLDILMPSSDPNGACPLEEGKTYTFDYTRKDHTKTDPDTGEEKTTYYYNYRWPYKGGGGGWKGGGGFGPKMMLSGTEPGVNPLGRGFHVEITCKPDDDVVSMASKVNEALNALKASEEAKPGKAAAKALPQAASPMQREKIADEVPF